MPDKYIYNSEDGTIKQVAPEKPAYNNPNWFAHEIYETTMASLNPNSIPVEPKPDWKDGQIVEEGKDFEIITLEHDAYKCGCENHASWCPFNPLASEVPENEKQVRQIARQINLKDSIDDIIYCGNCGYGFYACECGEWDPIYSQDVARPIAKEQAKPEKPNGIRIDTSYHEKIENNSLYLKFRELFFNTVEEQVWREKLWLLINDFADSKGQQHHESTINELNKFIAASQPSSAPVADIEKLLKSDPISFLHANAMMYCTEDQIRELAEKLYRRSAPARERHNLLQEIEKLKEENFLLKTEVANLKHPS